VPKYATEKAEVGGAFIFDIKPLGLSSYTPSNGDPAPDWLLHIMLHPHTQKRGPSMPPVVLPNFTNFSQILLS
jgi:hypothetical protein